MRSVAIGRVLERAPDRAAIGSPRDFRLAYLNELATHEDEIAVEADRILALGRKTLRCLVCDQPLTDVERISRRYCSDRCRQRAYRRRVSPVAMESIP